MPVTLHPIRRVVTLLPENRSQVVLGNASAAPIVVIGPARGAAGLPGADGSDSARFLHTQSVAALTWSVSHNLGRVPSVFLKTLGSAEIEGQIDHLSVNQFIVSFNSPQAGQAIYS